MHVRLNANSTPCSPAETCPSTGCKQALSPISSAYSLLQCYRHAARGVPQHDQLRTFSTIKSNKPLSELTKLIREHQINADLGVKPETCFHFFDGGASVGVQLNSVREAEREREQQIHHSTTHSPRGRRVQLTDLIPGVLTQFPESLDRCHF